MTQQVPGQPGGTMRPYLKQTHEQNRKQEKQQNHKWSQSGGIGLISQHSGDWGRWSQVQSQAELHEEGILKHSHLWERFLISGDSKDHNGGTGWVRWIGSEVQKEFVQTHINAWISDMIDNFKEDLFLCVVCMHMCSGSCGGQRESQIPWNQSYRRFMGAENWT